MKIQIPSKSGRVVTILKGTPPSSFIMATPEQEADILAGKTYWTPELNSNGKPVIIDGVPQGTLSFPPVPVPKTIANWQARSVLEMQGLLEAVDAAIAGMEGPEGIVARNAWQGAAPLYRKGPTIEALIPLLQLAEEQVDEMFIQAAALKY